TSKSNTTTSAVVHVTADLTPPTVRILANGEVLEDGKNYRGSVTLSVEASDAGSTSPPATTLLVDGAKITDNAAVTAPGGHSVVATAVDAASNDARVTRTFFIGSTGSGCALADFDPKDGSVVTSNSVTLIGT